MDLISELMRFESGKAEGEGTSGFVSVGSTSTEESSPSETVFLRASLKESRKGSDSVMGPVPKTIQSRLYSGKVSLIFLTNSKLGLFRPAKIWDTAEGCIPNKVAKSDAFRFLALMICAILSFILSRFFLILAMFRFTKVKKLNEINQGF